MKTAKSREINVRGVTEATDGVNRRVNRRFQESRQESEVLLYNTVVCLKFMRQ